MNGSKCFSCCIYALRQTSQGWRMENNTRAPGNSLSIRPACTVLIGILSTTTISGFLPFAMCNPTPTGGSTLGGGSIHNVGRMSALGHMQPFFLRPIFKLFVPHQCPTLVYPSPNEQINIVFFQALPFSPQYHRHPRSLVV